MALVLLANPAAGGGRGRRLLEQVAARLRTGGAEVRVLAGRDEREAAELAGQAVADVPQALVALGGDGLVGLAARVASGTGVPLGIIPCGTGNDGARALGIPLDPMAAADVVLAGATRRVDLGRVGGRVFLTVLSSGFDALVNERANAMAWPRGPARYKLAMLAELRVFRPVPYVLGIDGEEQHTDAMLVAVGNGPSYGAGMRVCPDADLSDGLLDVTVLTPMSKRAFLRIFPSVYRGEHVRSAAVWTARATRVTVQAPNMVAYADGERVGPLPVAVDVLPGAMTALVPGTA